jgi:DNA repair photolyase
MTIKKKIYSIDIVENSIAFGQINTNKNSESKNLSALRLNTDLSNLTLRSKYDRDSTPLTAQLESHLQRLSMSGELSKSEIIFGVHQDPFHPFEGHFDNSMKLLELFARYVPGHLTVQTRSPLLVIALPILKRLGNKLSVNISIETNCEESVSKYTPGLPRIEERYKLCTALRRFGIETNIVVSPIMPYGDWKHDAEKFASELVQRADHIFIQSFNSSIEMDKTWKNHSTITRLADERRFHWLRQDAEQPLLNAIGKIAQEKLLWPDRDCHKPRQLEIFAA